MAQGRFISKTICQSEKFAALQSHEHRLMYMMILPNVDCEGRHTAHPKVLAGMVYTLLDMSASEVERALEDMHDVGLITLYRSEGKDYLEINAFTDHNTVRRDRETGLPSHEKPSTIPPPTAEAASIMSFDKKRVPQEQNGADRGATELLCNAPDGVQSNSAVLQSDYVATPLKDKVKDQVKGEVQDQVKAKVQEPKTLVISANAENHRHAPSETHKKRESCNCDAFFDAWNANAPFLPQVSAYGRTDKRKRAIARMVKDIGDESLALDLFIKGTKYCNGDPHWQGVNDRHKRYGIDSFISKVIDKAEKYASLRNQDIPGAPRALSSQDRAAAETAARYHRVLERARLEREGAFHHAN